VVNCCAVPPMAGYPFSRCVSVGCLCDCLTTDEREPSDERCAHVTWECSASSFSRRDTFFYSGVDGVLLKSKSSSDLDRQF
jgi:hypothetical protein